MVRVYYKNVNMAREDWGRLLLDIFVLLGTDVMI